MTIEKCLAPSDANPFFSYLGQAASKNWKLNSSSPTFYCNGNVDDSMVIVLDYLKIIEVKLLLKTLRGRNTSGRKSKLSNLAILTHQNLTKNEKSEAIKKKLLSAHEMHFYGCKIVKCYGEHGKGIGVIRSFVFDNDKGKLTKKWSIHYPFYENEDGGDTEIMDVHDVARGMVDTHEAGQYGLFDSNEITTSSKSESSAMWQPKCIAGPNAKNPGRAYYNCSDPKSYFCTKYFRWETGVSYRAC